ncbi:MAG: hypothetical protein GF384_02150, partial [Elusimicrobia bacterium]|nr:hypothetical protein [Elusimicrobiota bacterium]
QASEVNTSSVTLTWSGDGTIYDVVKAADAGFGSEVSTFTLSAQTTTFMGLTDYTTYWFRVRAYNGDGVVTAFATEIATRTIFNAPTNHGAVVLGTDSMKWLWDDNSDNETGYRVYATTGGLISGNLDPDDTYYIRTDLSANTSYQTYVVAFGDDTYESLASNTTKYYTLTNDPDGLSVVAVYKSSVTVEWNGNGGSYYEVVTASDTDYSVGVDTITLTGEATTFFSLDSYTTYYFKVRAFNGDDIATLFTGSISTRTLPSNVPAAPAGFDGVVKGVDSIEWGWDDLNTTEDGYRVYNATDSLLVQSLGPDTTYWLMEDLQANTSYAFFVRAYNVQGESLDSDHATYYTFANIPGNVALSEVHVSSVTLTWTGDGSYYDTVKASDNSFSTEVATFTLSGLTTGFAGLDDYTEYWFRVRAYNGDDIPTEFVTAISTKTLLNPPDNFIGLVQSTGSIKYTWTDNSNNESGYRVYNATNSVAVSGDLGQGVEEYTYENLRPNTSYQTYVVAFGQGSDESLPSATTEWFTFANIPSSLQVNAVYRSSVTVSWTGDGSQYDVVAASDTGFSVGVSTINLSEATTTFYGLDSYTTYWFRVRAYNGDGVMTEFTSVEVSTKTLPSDVPGKPQNFTGVVKGIDSIEWGWDDLNTTEDGYRVYNATNSQMMQGVGANTTYWLNTELRANTSYQYYVKAYNVHGESLASDTTTWYTWANVPGSLQASEVNTSSVTLTWSGDGTIYDVVKAADAGFGSEVSTFTLSAQTTT